MISDVSHMLHNLLLRESAFSVGTFLLGLSGQRHTCWGQDTGQEAQYYAPGKTCASCPFRLNFLSARGAWVCFLFLFGPQVLQVHPQLEIGCKHCFRFLWLV